MCTVSWFFGAGEYSLFANRDERRTRKPALPPVIRQIAGVRILAPVDGDFGGTWIGANEFGVSLCVLNLYQSKAIEPPEFATSRGVLVLSLLSATHLAGVRERFGATNLDNYQPFTLVGLEVGRPVLFFAWDGVSCTTDPDATALQPLISSGYDLAGVTKVRRALFQNESRRDVDSFARFHRSHEPERGPYSPCMHRDDASTVSFSHVRVSATQVEVRYTAGSPCSPLGEYRATLERRTRRLIGQ